MATRNRTPIFRKYRDALRSVRVSSPTGPSGGGGPVIELVSASLLRPDRSYTPLSTEDPGPSRWIMFVIVKILKVFILQKVFRKSIQYDHLWERHLKQQMKQKITTQNMVYKKVFGNVQGPHGSQYLDQMSRDAVTIGLPPAWVDVSEEIAGNMQRARTKMSELAKVHAKALMPSFGDSKEDHHMIELLTHEITDLLKKSKRRLQKFSPSGPSEDSNVRKNVQRSLATDLQKLSMEFRKKQSSYLTRLRQQKEGQDGVDLEMNLTGPKSEIEDDEYGDVGFNDFQISKLKKSEAFTREREREISQVVESVSELAQIMKDLSVLVIDQGTIIDRIDYNIQNVAVSVEEGNKQLEKAERNQRKGGMVMCVTALVIMCFIMIVLLILKEILF